MTKEELITNQQLEICELKSTIAEFESAKQEVHQAFYNIGAPLNDNCLQFNKDQRAVLHRVAKILDLDD